MARKSRKDRSKNRVSFNDLNKMMSDITSLCKPKGQKHDLEIEVSGMIFRVDLNNFDLFMAKFTKFAQMLEQSQAGGNTVEEIDR